MSCTWREDPDGNWHTDCGHIFCFVEGGPTENQVKFCGYCGSRIFDEPFVDHEEED